MMLVNMTRNELLKIFSLVRSYIGMILFTLIIPLILWGYGNNTLRNNTIEDNSIGVYGWPESRNQMSNNTFSNNTAYAVYLEENDHVVIDNNTVDEYNYMLVENSSVDSLWLLGTKLTALNSPVEGFYTDPASNFTRQWYMHVNVTNETGDPLPEATIRVMDNSNGTFVEHQTTNAFGRVDWIRTTEYVSYGDQITYYTPHNVAAYNLTLQGYALPEPWMDMSKMVDITLSAGNYNLFLEEGWNFLSIPYVQSSRALTDVFSSIDGDYDRIQVYNGSSGGDPWMSNFTSKPYYMNDLEEVGHLEGIWVRITRPGGTTFSPTGLLPDDTSNDMILYPGWNLVGYPSLRDSYNVSTQMAGIDYSVVVTYDDTGNQITLANDAEMYRGQAYWIYLNGDTAQTWSVKL